MSTNGKRTISEKISGGAFVMFDERFVNRLSLMHREVVDIGK